MFKKKKNNNYISIKESRQIIKYNIKQMKYYESLKNRNLELNEYTSIMNDDNNIVEIDNLRTCFFTDNGTVKSVNGVSFNIPKNKIVGVVGESGCGKSVTSLSIMQLIQAPQGQVVGGEIRFNSDSLGYDEQGKKICFDIAKMPTKEMTFCLSSSKKPNGESAAGSSLRWWFCCLCSLREEPQPCSTCGRG